MTARFVLTFIHLFLALGAVLLPTGATRATERACSPTPPDMLGPFYKPDAPERTSVGSGYVLSGLVRSAPNCAPLRGARIEFWLAGPNGHYDDAHRATVFADKNGRYRFESSFPPPYGGRPPHIHVRVTAQGHETLVTQHYPVVGGTAATQDLTLLPR